MEVTVLLQCVDGIMLIYSVPSGEVAPRSIAFTSAGLRQAMSSSLVVVDETPSQVKREIHGFWPTMSVLEEEDAGTTNDIGSVLSVFVTDAP